MKRAALPVDYSSKDCKDCKDCKDRKDCKIQKINSNDSTVQTTANVFKIDGGIYPSTNNGFIQKILY